MEKDTTGILSIINEMLENKDISKFSIDYWGNESEEGSSPSIKINVKKEWY